MTRRWIVGLLGFVLAAGAAAPAAAQPTWWLTVGGQASVETGSLKHTLETEGSVLVGLGWHLLRLGPLLIGPEVEGDVGRVRAQLGIDRDTVTTWRGRAGLRATWWEEDDEPTLVPYVRGGGVYRWDRGDLVKDDGAGWYAGAGIDLRLGEHVALGPFATYEQIDLSIPTKTWLFGLGLRLDY